MNIVKSLLNWGLVFTVRLPKSGSVFRSLGQQVVDQLRSVGVVLPGYDDTVRWECPQDLPFAVLAGTGNGLVKTHSPYDTFNEVQFTYVTLTGKRPPLTSIPCPVGEDLMQLPHLRLGKSLTL